MNVTKPRRTRRTHSEEFKQSLIEACGEPGASVAGVALANGINANQLRRWMRERGIEPPELSCMPLRVAASEPMGAFVPVQLSSCPDAPIRIDPKNLSYPTPFAFSASKRCGFGGPIAARVRLRCAQQRSQTDGPSNCSAAALTQA